MEEEKILCVEPLNSLTHYLFMKYPSAYWPEQRGPCSQGITGYWSSMISAPCDQMFFQGKYEAGAMEAQVLGPQPWLKVWEVPWEEVTLQVMQSISKTQTRDSSGEKTMCVLTAEIKRKWKITEVFGQNFTGPVSPISMAGTVLGLNRKPSKYLLAKWMEQCVYD